MSRVTAEHKVEAEQLSGLVRDHAGDLAEATLGKSFALDGARFRLHAKNRNTIYRVAGRFDWFLKLSPPADTAVMPRELLGAEYCNRVLGNTGGYAGPFVSRVSLSPPFVLADAVSGPPMTRVLINGTWVPGSSARGESALATLGALLSVLHADKTLPVGAPEATKRPFEVVRQLAERLRDRRDQTAHAVLQWSQAARGGEEEHSFIHGNLRLDNLLLSGNRIGLVDFENCGSGPRYQDASRPITQLLLLRASLAAPSARIDRFLGTFMSAYRTAQPYDIASLGDWVTVRLARYYLESLRPARPGHKGGFPVVR